VRLKSFLAGFAYRELVVSFLFLYGLSGFYILTVDWFCLPLRNAVPTNTSFHGAYSAPRNGLLSKLAHGECATILISIAALLKTARV